MAGQRLAGLEHSVFSVRKVFEETVFLAQAG